MSTLTPPLLPWDKIFSKKTKLTRTTSAQLLEGVPQYVLDHAPLLHLHSKEVYRPSSIAAQVAHTHPELNFETVDIPAPPCDLFNLDRLNTIADGGKSVYLTSNDDITAHPTWLEGVEMGKMSEEKTSVVIVVDKGEGIVDAFYFYFFAFNWGGVVLEKQLGDHVGDWEHNMIRFENGQPQYIWLSQHANGEAYTFKCLKKDSSGNRPLLYCAKGSHAIYATPGTHDHTIPNLPLPVPLLLVDETDAGPLYDPLPSAYFYAATATEAPTFTPYDTSTPVGFLLFAGRWGDEEYPEDDARQKGKGLLGFKKYVGGPTGPADKQLGRKEVWPENQLSGGQRIRTRLRGEGWFGRITRAVGGKRVKKVEAVRRAGVNGEIMR